MLPPGRQPLYFILVLCWRLSNVSPPSMFLGWSYTVDMWKSVLAFFTGCRTNFSPWYLQKINSKPLGGYSKENKTKTQLKTCKKQNFCWLFYSICVFIHTQILFCNWDVGPHSQVLQKYQSDCVPTLRHPSSPAFPLHDDQIPKNKKPINIWNSLT